MTKYYKVLLSIVIIGSVIILIIFINSKLNNSSREFDGQKAFENVKYQVGLGPRTMGSSAHDLVSNWIVSDLLNLSWRVDTQETITSGIAIKNIIAQKGSNGTWVIIASHY